MPKLGFEWILAHRGVWSLANEQNTKDALLRGVQNGFGVESDFRDAFGQLVISHDPPIGKEFLPFDHSFSSNRVAYNIKSDGLDSFFLDFCQNMTTTSSFVFDGSIPEMLRMKKLNIPHALRLSEYESELPWFSDYVWVDGFEGDWWLKNAKILKLMETRHVIFVSPELHQREYKNAFEWFTELRELSFNNFSVCTDFPLILKSLNE